MSRQPETNFSNILAQWPESADQAILNRRPEVQTLTILYERLSHDDDFAGESNSIKNQKALLQDYALKNNLANIIHLTDDGVSGTRFDRPGFLKAMDLVEAGCVGVFVVKDLSRFGRDHLRVGLYTERFRECGVRFIAIQDNVDTANGEDDFIPFRNIINEWAARDSSRKTKAVFKAKGMEGKPLSSHCIYGFRKDPDDKYKWLIDEEAAAVVRRIFQMTIEGMGPYQIAHQLSNEKIERPSYYHGKQGLGHSRYNYDTANPYSWYGSSIVTILKNPGYKGCLVNFKTSKDSYKDKHRKMKPKDEWVIFEGALEPIVDAETWELAQKLRKTVRRTDSLEEANPLTGLLYCADCGGKLWNHRTLDPKTFARSDGTQYKRPPVDYYNCSTFKRFRMKYVKKCSPHNIRTRVVRELALDTIRQVCRFVRTNEDGFMNMLREESAVKQAEAAKSHKKQISKNEKRISELDILFRKTYEDFAAGRLTEKRFEQLSGGYETEQTELETLTADLRAELDAFNSDSVKGDKFIDIVSRYTDFTELTPQMLNEFVEKIVVHEAGKSSGERHQQVEIYLNIIGKFEVPEEYDGLTETEREEQRRIAEKRAHQRAYNRKFKAKKQQEKEQAALTQEQAKFA